MSMYEYEGTPQRVAPSSRSPRAGHHVRTRFIRTPAYVEAERLVYAPENASIVLATAHVLNLAAENAILHERALQKIRALVQRLAYPVRHTRGEAFR